LQDTPEWKRRLLHGDVAYGEQRDLFSPIGLESIFKPPPTSTRPSSVKSPEQQLQSEDATMRSSPPPYASKTETQPSAPSEPKAISYKIADNGSDQFSEYDLSQSSSFRPRNTVSRKPSAQPPLAHISESKIIDSSAFSEVKHKAEDPRRLVSGQSDIRHEDLSPIYISRHNTVDGRVDYAALDISPGELQQRLQDLTVEEEGDISHSQNNTLPQQLPEDPTVDTEDFAHNGNFVSVARGGHSQEGSFQRRMLSPSSMPSSVPGIEESAMLQEESIQASTPKQLPTIRKTRASDEFDFADLDNHDLAPRTPQSSPIKEERPISKSSPLKLFGAYDTFTNQKLLRRLSQFENSLPDEDSKATNQDSRGEETSTRTGINEAYIAPSSPSKAAIEKSSIRQGLQAYSSFGDGKLDQFEFQEEASLPSWLSSEPEDEGNVSIAQEHRDVRPIIFDLPPSLNVESESASRNKTATFTSRTIGSSNAKKLAHRRQKSSISSPNLPSLNGRELLSTPRKRDGDSQGKRLPRSPLKDPTPKRRRTLHKSDIAHLSMENGVSDSILESHQNIQSVIGRKRKDARHDDNHQSADPEVMAMRQVLRPRAATFNQRRSFDGAIQRNVTQRPLPLSEKEKLEQQQKIAKVQAELDMTHSSGPFVASAISHHMINESRKPSVTTQDFLDEAKKIMAGIRGKARPRSGLNSMEESESEVERLDYGANESEDPEHESSYQESTQEPFSRPPSREGGGPVPLQPKKQSDPELLSHLRKYEERSDFDAMIASSMRSAAQTHETEVGMHEVDPHQDEAQRTPGWTLNHNIPYESDPPNIQITEYPELQRKRKHSTSSAPGANVDGSIPSQVSNPSSAHSTSRSVPTGSSRGSDSRRVIAPHTVSHLIPEQLAGMLFDREKGAWIKRKSVMGSKSGENSLPSEDDDPFGDIPDLTVDETQEMQRIQAVAERHREEARLSVVQEYQKSQFDVSQDLKVSLPQAFDNPISTNKLQSSQSESSKFIRSSSSATARDTRITSWGDEAAIGTKSDVQIPINNTAHHVETIATTTYHEEVVHEETEEVEEEISIHESRTQSWNGNKPRRNVTISFSSPVASIIQDSLHEHAAASIFDHYYGDSEDRSDLNEPADAQTLQQKIAVQLRSSQRAAPRKSSLGGQNFMRRPVSRIDERDEDSFADYINNGGPQRSLSVVITTPMPVRSTSQQISTLQRNSPDVAAGHDSVFQLSPLSDFTLNRAEESFAFEVSYVAPVIRHQHGNGSRRSLSMTVKELVQRITDVEPYEPFWEHIKQIELKKKQLQSLHMLNRFCGQLEELDVSDNDIAQLDGAPETIRHLRITHNSLSDLTSWHHLRNLQYLDISNNDLTSLEGLKDLVHLRAIRADNNKIQSLAGVFNLDGLINLRLRNNVVESVDFTGCKLQRLTDLDLKGNRLNAIAGLQELQSLSTLHLEDNNLEAFNEAIETLWALKYLKLGGNSLQQIDVSSYPNLRLLYLDRNSIGSVTGLLKTKHLDSLSMREQQDSTIDMSFLDQVFEVRKLFLSGNLLSSFAPRVDFLNLQYLEMANCGLDCLPADFGEMICNIRVLNLNFNALRDIKPLVGIVRLKRLHLAGNRLSRLRKTTGVLGQFSSLANVDLRNNPLTLGFYPVVTEKMIVLHKGTEDEAEAVVEDPFTLMDANEGKDKAYAGRLDMETKMRRRVYEMLMVAGCERLRMLDGLPANRQIADVKDAVWDELVKIGLVHGNFAEIEAAPQQEFQGNEAQADEPEENAVIQEEVVEEKQGEIALEAQNVEAAKEEEREEQWPAEDSFA